MNYQRVDADLLVAGIVVRDYPGVPTDARQRVLRRVGTNVISRAALEKTLSRGDAATAALEAELRGRMDQMVEEYRARKGFERDVIELLRPELQQTLAQVHDYKQFVQQIVQNLDVILETRFPGESIDDKLSKAEHEEVAIYWAAQLMDEKLDAALYLLYPERIHELRDRGRFRFHGLVTKYRKIYERQMDAKHLRIRSEGESRAIVEANSRALSIIPHTFIDNAVKYAPEGSTITFVYEESGDTLKFSVESFGPPILEGERDKVFELFFRGVEARRLNSEGTGFGLASARNVADALELSISLCQQERPVGPNNTKRTIASVVLPIVSDAPLPGRGASRNGRPRSGRRRRDRR